MRYQRPDDGEITLRFTWIHKKKGKPTKEVYEQLAIKEINKNIVFKHWDNQDPGTGFKITILINYIKEWKEYHVTAFLSSDYL